MSERYGYWNWTLDFRPYERGWEKPYRVRVMPMKQERQEYRITAFGDTEEEAHANARAKLQAQRKDLT
jgi:hypothetical protein